MWKRKRRSVLEASWSCAAVWRPARAGASRTAARALAACVGRRVAVFGGFAVSAACVLSTPASAQDSAGSARTLHPEAEEAISRVRSPFCPGLMLEVCPSAPAQALRDSLDAQAEAGLPADSLVEMVVASYGEEYRAVPKASGAGLLAWVMPPVALAVGLGLVLLALRRLRAPTGSPSAADLSDEEQERVRQALADFEQVEELRT